MGDETKACQATPAATLEAYIMGTGPKNEQEHWAYGEITRLRAAIAAMKPYLAHRVGCEFLRCVAGAEFEGAILRNAGSRWTSGTYQVTRAFRARIDAALPNC